MVQETRATYQTGKGVGYHRGQPSDFNAEFAVDEAKFWQFLEATQPDELAKLHYKPDYRCQILECLQLKLKKNGILSVLRKGLNTHSNLLYRIPFERQRVRRFRRRLRFLIRQTPSGFFSPALP